MHVLCEYTVVLLRAFLQLEMLDISVHTLWQNHTRLGSRWVCLAMPEFLFVLGSLPSCQVSGRAPTWPCAVW